MKRWIATLGVALVVVAAARETDAQARSGASEQQPVAVQAPPARPTPPPAAGSRFTSTLRFVPPPRDVRPRPLLAGPFVAQRPFISGSMSGRFGFWPWGAWLPVPLYSGYTEFDAYEAPLEGAPVGGLQLDIDPRRAQVFVDGTYAGLVEEFSGYFQHLKLPAGPHNISVVAPGYEPLSLHVIVSPGATMTQRASLSRAYGR
jgi:hypothetical protein